MSNHDEENGRSGLDSSPNSNSATSSRAPKYSLSRKIAGFLMAILFFQGVMICGYYLLENSDQIAYRIERVGHYFVKDPSQQQRATFISLVRNNELDDLLGSIKMVEDTFNKKYGYPWTFFNDEPFSKEFKKRVSEAVSSKVEFVKIKPEDWNEPSWIDKEKAKDEGLKLKQKGVGYADMPSYHKMCRWNSGKFYQNPVMDKYKYYWRVEPKTKYFCDIDYDVFEFMENKDLDYGFVINIYDSALSVKTLWNATWDFLNDNPQYIHENNAQAWLTQDEHKKSHNDVAGYSTCHFWSNFEIGKLDFFRSKAYMDYFDYLDHRGGFFYERWGDAPVHSVALGLMTDVSKIHYFDDIGYYHFPYFNCPNSDKCRGCKADQFTQEKNLDNQNCMGQWKKMIEANK